MASDTNSATKFIKYVGSAIAKNISFYRLQSVISHGHIMHNYNKSNLALRLWMAGADIKEILRKIK